MLAMLQGLKLGEWIMLLFIVQYNVFYMTSPGLEGSCTNFTHFVHQSTSVGK